MNLQCTFPAPFPAAPVPAETNQLLPTEFEPDRASLELRGTAILLAEGTALGVVRYEMTSRASHTGEWASAGVLHAPAGLIDGALRGAMITLRDEANAVELDIIVVRHEIGACEADIMLDEEACLSLAETDARLQLYG